MWEDFPGTNTEGGESRVHVGAVQNPSGVDGDDLASTSAHKENPI